MNLSSKAKQLTLSIGQIIQNISTAMKEESLTCCTCEGETCTCYMNRPTPNPDPKPSTNISTHDTLPFIPEEIITLEKVCSVTNKTYSLTISRSKFDKYLSGKSNIQDIFPELSPSQREFIITQTTPAEWEELFGREEDLDNN